MSATKLTLPHIFRVGIILVLDFWWIRRSTKQAFQ